MEFIVEPSTVKGAVSIPASKSHTIRALFLGMLGQGQSSIRQPLKSRDTLAAADAVRAFGAVVEDDGRGGWTVHGLGGRPQLPAGIIDVQNSGTTLRIAMGAAALANGTTTLTGDDQIRKRPVGALAQCLTDLGAPAKAQSTGCPPVTVSGPLRGGATTLRAITSQFVTSLLLACPFAENDSVIDILEMNEAPYVFMTLNWMDRVGLKYENHDMRRFVIPGGQGHAGFSARVPADFSSATFFLVAAAATGGELVLEGLDMKDTQGDSAVVYMLEEMGAEVEILDMAVRIKGRGLSGREFDMNYTPDALPAMAVAGCLASGTTKLLNCPQARFKETDRIDVMARELSKMGAHIEQLDDGLIIRESPLAGTRVHGHHDHRVVMALAVAGMAAQGTTAIETAEAADVTFPNFADLMASAGARIRNA